MLYLLLLLLLLSTICMSRDYPGDVDQAPSTRQEIPYLWPLKPENAPLCEVDTAQASSTKRQPRSLAFSSHPTSTLIYLTFNFNKFHFNNDYNNFSLSWPCFFICVY